MSSTYASIQCSRCNALRPSKSEMYIKFIANSRAHPGWNIFNWLMFGTSRIGFDDWRRWSLGWPHLGKMFSICGRNLEILYQICNCFVVEMPFSPGYALIKMSNRFIFQWPQNNTERILVINEQNQMLTYACYVSNSMHTAASITVLKTDIISNWLMFLFIWKIATTFTNSNF